MVRLVFRRYSQVRRSICTLESLRTSTRVSPGFVLLRYSSPSFGSRHVCSHSNLSLKRSWSVDSAAVKLPTKANLYFHYALGDKSRALAHMSDSLVRVSRRVDKSYFVKVIPLHNSKIHKQVWILLFLHNETSLTKKKTKVSLPSLTPIGSISAISGTFHSLFKVLFIFPSRYLFAIGLPPIFSFRWNLPPN